MFRVGHGYDVHRLVEGRKLILGGVELQYERGLLGHSDADVLVHAIMDALLGAAALGDIGKLFPDTDERYSGADSLGLLAEVMRALRAAGREVSNIDATVIAQRPKLAPHIEAMRANIARAAGLDVSQVSVKATTEEKLGFTARASASPPTPSRSYTEPVITSTAARHPPRGGFCRHLRDRMGNAGILARGRPAL